MADLPESTVEVVSDSPEVNHHRTTITVKRDGSKTVCQTGEADTPNVATARAVKQVLKDRGLIEHIDRKS